MLSRVKSFLGSGLLLGGLGLAACGSSSLGDQPVVSGQINNWGTSGSGLSLRALVLKAGDIGVPLATAPIDAAGQFSITLPGGTDVAPYLGHQHIDPAQVTLLSLFSDNQTAPTCPGGMVQSDQPDYGIVALFMEAYRSDGTSYRSVAPTVTPAASSQTLTTYVYVDRDVNESGTMGCTIGATPGSETIDVQFSRGWNLQSYTFLGNSLTSVTTVTLPANTSLTWTSAD